MLRKPSSLYERAETIQLVQSQSLQIVHQCLHDFIRNVVLLRNESVFWSTAFPKTCVDARNSVVYVYGRGVVIISQFIEIENFDSGMVQLLKSKNKI